MWINLVPLLHNLCWMFGDVFFRVECGCDQLVKMARWPMRDEGKSLWHCWHFRCASQWNGYSCWLTMLQVSKADYSKKVCSWNTCFSFGGIVDKACWSWWFWSCLHRCHWFHSSDMELGARNWWLWNGCWKMLVTSDRSSNVHLYWIMILLQYIAVNVQLTSMKTGYPLWIARLCIYRSVWLCWSNEPWWNNVVTQELVQVTRGSL